MPSLSESDWIRSRHHYSRINALDAFDVPFGEHERLRARSIFTNDKLPNRSGATNLDFKAVQSYVHDFMFAAIHFLLVLLDGIELGCASQVDFGWKGRIVRTKQFDDLRTDDYQDGATLTLSDDEDTCSH